MKLSSMLKSVAVASVAMVVACGGSSNGPNPEPMPTPEPPGTISWIEIEVGEFVFDARVAGPEDGEPVLLLHGFPETSAEWKDQLRALGEAGYRVVAPDQRGYSSGARPADTAAYGMVNLAGDVTGMADALGFDRFHLVGHDWGAAVAWFIGIIQPGRLLTLNPISVPHLDAFAVTRSDPESCQSSASGYMDFFIQPDSHEQMLANDAAFLRSMYEGLPEENVEEYIEVLTQSGALKAGLDWYRANSLGSGGAALGNVSVPTMYIWSTGDTALCEDGAYLTEEYVDGPYRFEVIDGASHWVPEVAAEIVSELLLDHLAAYPAS